MDLSKIALIVSVIAALIGIFGGVPGIKDLFFSKPNIEIIGFMPVVVFDDGNNSDTQYPKFSLKGVLKLSNPNDFDVNINEIKIYGRSQDSSGQYKFPGNKPILYEMNLVGTVEKGEDIVKSHGSAFLRFNIAHFENTDKPGIMRAPMKAVGNSELGHPIFHIYVPSFNQLFKFNSRRVPFELVEHVQKGELNIAVVFNNELVKIKPNIIFSLHQILSNEWDNQQALIQIFNAKKDM